MTNEELLDAYRKARQLLVEKGWIKGGYYAAPDPFFLGQQGGYCAMGALGEAKGVLTKPISFSPTGEKENGGYMPCHERFALSGPLVAHTGLPGSIDIAGWNDHPGRTKEEVLEAFDAVIAKLEEQVVVEEQIEETVEEKELVAV